MLHFHSDKIDRTDPTGTANVRRKFAGQARIRWQRIAILVRDMILQQDILALKSGGLMTIQQPAIQGGATKVDVFQRWFDLTLNTVLLNLDGDFMKPLLDEAYAMGETFGQNHLQTDISNPMAKQRLLTLQKLAFIEMQGIIEAVSQQSVRAVANGLLHGDHPRIIVATIKAVIVKIGIVRSNALADMLVVKSFNEAALDVYEAAGHTHVGVLAEMRARFIATDARTTGPGSRISRTKAPSLRTIQRIRANEKRLEKRFGKNVRIRTAGDDDVCPICEGIEENGPYPINKARSLIPAHPHCRCAFVPTKDKRFAQDIDAAMRISDFLMDTYDPNQPRDPGGEHGGEWVKGEAGSNSTKEFTKEEEAAAIKEYRSGIYNSTNGGFVNAQSFLRTGKISYPHGGFTNEAAAAHAQTLGSAFSKAKLEKEMTVYRGASIRSTDPQEILHAKEGSIISNKGVTSATTSNSIAIKFASKYERERNVTGVKMTIKLKAGTRAIHIGGHEKEVIVEPNTSFKVVSRKIRGGIHHLEVETMDSIHDKYDPNQPRDPGGEHGGEWTRAGWSESGELEVEKPAFPMSKRKDVQSLIASKIEDVRPELKTITPSMYSHLRATQSDLKPYSGSEEDEDATPLFKSYADRPVVLYGKDKLYHVADGHNRISAAVRAGRAIKVYLFKETELVEDKYNPNQPRDPGGEHGGEWVSGSTPSVDILSRMPDDLSDDDLIGIAAKAKTGEKFSGDLYRGEGTNNARIPSQFGEGVYYTPNEFHAATYGTNVTKQHVTLNNPRVWDLPNKTNYRSELQAEFGTSDPATITSKLQSQGHDGLIIRNVPIQRYPVGGTGAEVVVFKAKKK